MLNFLRFSVLYFACAAVFSIIVRDGEIVQVFGGVRQLGLLVWSNVLGISVLLTVVGACYYSSGRNRAVITEAALALVATGFFKVGFTTFKGSMPFAKDFYADEFLAKLDNFLHFGVDPWELTHQLAPFINPTLAGVFYIKVWLMLSLGFPLLLAVTDNDKVRRVRYLVLYSVTWIGIGNVFALIGMSGGPIFYDNIIGGDRFAGLHRALDEGGVSMSLVGWVQQYLWANYTTAQNAIGSGISAFPSVHVAMATVLGLYLAERQPRLRPLAVAYVASIMFLSVYLGWHYAVDGYFSIAVVICASIWLGRSIENTGRADLSAGLTHSTMVR